MTVPASRARLARYSARNCGTVPWASAALRPACSRWPELVLRSIGRDILAAAGQPGREQLEADEQWREDHDGDQRQLRRQQGDEPELDDEQDRRQHDFER